MCDNKKGAGIVKNSEKEEWQNIHRHLQCIDKRHNAYINSYTVLLIKLIITKEWKHVESISAFLQIFTLRTNINVYFA
jgi:hypothetical protein